MQDFGSFFVRKPFDVSQENCLALRLRQGVDAPDHLRGQHFVLRQGFAIERQLMLGVDETLALTHPLRAKLVEPDRVHDRQQPAIQPSTRHELLSAFERAYAGGLDQIVRQVFLSRQH